MTGPVTASAASDPLPPRFLASAGARVRLVAFAALLLAFLAGSALGWGVGHHGRWWAGHGGAFGEPGWGLGGHGPLDRLSLTPSQRTVVDSIFRTRRAQIDAFWEGPGRQLRSILDSTAHDVRAVLDSSQRATFDAMQERRRRHGRGTHGLFSSSAPPPPPSGGAERPTRTP